MNIFDILLSILLLWSAIRGFSKGLIHQMASLAALLLGIWGAIRFGQAGTDILVNRWGVTGKYTEYLSFIIIFVLIVISVHLLSFVIDKVVSAVALGFFNRLGGAVFGIFKTVLLLSIVLVLFDTLNERTSFVSKERMEESFLYNPLRNVAPTLFPYFREGFSAIRDKNSQITLMIK